MAIGVRTRSTENTFLIFCLYVKLCKAQSKALGVRTHFIENTFYESTFYESTFYRKHIL